VVTILVKVIESQVGCNVFHREGVASLYIVSLSFENGLLESVERDAHSFQTGKSVGIQKETLPLQERPIELNLVNLFYQPPELGSSVSERSTANEKG